MDISRSSISRTDNIFSADFMCIAVFTLTAGLYFSVGALNENQCEEVKITDEQRVGAHILSKLSQ